MKTVDEMMMENTNRMFDAIFNGKPVRQLQGVPELVAPGLVDDRTQDQARLEFIQDMDEDRLLELREQISGEVFDRLMEGDAIAAQVAHDKFFDRVMERAGA